MITLQYVTTLNAIGKEVDPMLCNTGSIAEPNHNMIFVLRNAVSHKLLIDNYTSRNGVSDF